jgi:hypothetical protein
LQLYFHEVWWRISFFLRAAPQSRTWRESQEFYETVHVMYEPGVKARFMLQIGWGTMRNSVSPNVPS